jgi:CxxC-x17-CxxC domain-containing protein
MGCNMSKFKKSKEFVHKDFVKKDFGARNFSNAKKSFNPQGFEKKVKSSGFELYTAVCDKCGMNCDLPFKPTNNKPVYCRSCFRKVGSEGNRSERSFNSNDRNDRSFDSRERNSRETFRDKVRSDAVVESNISAGELEKINQKLDKIMKALKIN